jgi:3-methylcrotonyl-CoA carboxylase alpha subunit
VLLERLIARPRHIEVQVFGDRHGNVVHLFERDCSLQRRNQKVIEEAPAPGLSPALRARMCEAAVACARAVGYEGAGTVEFLVEGGGLGADAPWYFIEMNTRLQVEHPVTEAITGLDLVEWQLRVASGEPLPLRQDQITMSGHAIEARLNAEDPARGFLPSTGPVVLFQPPDGVRVDAGIEQGSVISPYYDSMIAKLIAAAPDRATAIAHLAQALEHTQVAGPKTNAAFLHALLRRSAFVEGAMDTGLIGREIAALSAETVNPEAIGYGVAEMLSRAWHDLAGRRALRVWGDGFSPWNANDGFQLGGPRRQRLTILADGAPTEVEVEWGSPLGLRVRLPGSDGPPYTSIVGVAGDSSPLYVLHGLRQTELRWPTFESDADAGAGDGASIRAPIIGRVAKVLVEPGDTVAKGDRIAVVEAMKMEHVLHAPRDGVVAKVAVAEGQQVEQGALVAALAE